MAFGSLEKSFGIWENGNSNPGKGKVGHSKKRMDHREKAIESLENGNWNTGKWQLEQWKMAIRTLKSGVWNTGKSQFTRGPCKSHLDRALSAPQP